MILFPNAKINIGLNIVSRREDGYHNIETVMYPIGWSDVLEIVPARGNDATLTVTGREVNCPPEKNLVMKAFRLFQENTGIGNVDIYLHKIIPDGAGLGGGSADAAFTLIGLNKMFECNLNNEQLAAIAAKIGADCPFFILNKPAYAEGIGERLRPISWDLKGWYLCVVRPNIPVPTREAFAHITPRHPEHCCLDIVSQPVETWRDLLVNDFEYSVFRAYPQLAAVKKQLYNLGAVYAAMSGSGSALFGLFRRPVSFPCTSPDTFTTCLQL